MCGIAGIIGLGPEKQPTVIRAMTAALQHRGPDAEAQFESGSVALGHTRLSIIDLTDAANQPFTDATGRYTIVFNGEIYNYQEVRSRLSYPWRTSSDTEVILAAYIDRGAACLELLNGMFAFAIWDTYKEELFIARDRMGVKPFYYHQANGIFCFASELRSILASGVVPRRLNRNALAEYLSDMSPRMPHTMIEGIQQLPPGQYGKFARGILQLFRYWNINTPKANILSETPETYDDAVMETRELMEAAVKSRMVADVPVAAFLSGGIDSSAIVGLMAQNAGTSVKTFSIVFEEPEYDERQYSRAVARKWGTDHTELLLRPNSLIEDLPGYIARMDAPTLDGLNTYTVSGMVAQTGVKVAVSGLGGDELFGGYPGFEKWRQFQRFAAAVQMPSVRRVLRSSVSLLQKRSIRKLHDFFGHKHIGLAEFYESSRAIFLRKEVAALAGDNTEPVRQWADLNTHEISTLPLVSRYSIAELTHYTLNVLLKDSDQMSMAWALEVREPFFDYRLVSRILSMPDEYKLGRGNQKQLLIDAMGDMLPAEIVNRPKKGFAFPWKQWISGRLAPWCLEAVESFAKRGILNPAVTRALWSDFLAGRNGVTWMHVWSIAILERWMVHNGIE
jgi:asparagine synthase (glutamine-hydrolysing)